MEPQKDPNLNHLSNPTTSPADDEIDLRELFTILWEGKWIIIAITFVFAVGSVLYALSLPNTYKADVLLAPSENSNGGSLSQMAGQFGGLAALAGVNLGSPESSQADLAMKVIKSRQFLDKFITENELLVPLMAVKGWDVGKNELLIDDEVYDKSKNTWLREPKDLRGAKPTAQEAFEVFINDILNVNKDKESGLYTLSITYYSPYMAKKWLDLLIKEINDVMRERAIAEASQNLQYLNTQLTKTAVAEMQGTFYKLIEEQTKSLMLAEVQDEFIFKTIDPAVVPEIKDGPKRALICIITTFFGFVLAVSIVLLRTLYAKIHRR